MSSAMKEELIQRLGVEAGTVFYDRQQGGKRAADTAAQQERLRSLQAEKGAKEAELAKLLAPLQAANDAAHAEWLRTAKALETQRIANQSAMADINNRIAELRQSLNVPLIHGRYTWEKVKVNRPDAM